MECENSNVFYISGKDYSDILHCGGGQKSLDGSNFTFFEFVKRTYALAKQIKNPSEQDKKRIQALEKYIQSFKEEI